MEIISLNVGVPEEVVRDGQKFLTSINKTPVFDKRKVSFMNVEGDIQSDLKVHGGRDKAVYSYSTEYYEEWKKIIQRNFWYYGLFGENLTTKGLLDKDVRIGNIYKIGSVILQAVQPRFPCYKLNYKFGLPNMAELFKDKRMNGIYFRVIEEGEMRVYDKIELLKESDYNVTILEVVECRATKGRNKEKLEEILKIPYLPVSLRMDFERFRT